MAKHWISNTIFLHGFTNVDQLYSFLEIISNYPRTEHGIEMSENCVIDTDYFTINIANIMSKLRLSISFLTDNNIAREHAAAIFVDGYQHLKMTYTVIDTRTEGVELYNFTAAELISHKSVPRGLGRSLLEEMERLPDPDKNISLSINDLDLLTAAEFKVLVAKISTARD